MTLYRLVSACTTTVEADAAVLSSGDGIHYLTIYYHNTEEHNLTFTSTKTFYLPSYFLVFKTRIF
jgi:hypothetical protein